MRLVQYLEPLREGQPDRISSTPVAPSEPLLTADKGNVRKSRRHSTAFQPNKFDPRQSLKFFPKNFVTKWAGDLEKHYEMGEILGSGGYGDVYVCTHIETAAERAVKVVPKSSDEEKNAMVHREFEVLKELDHPNVLKNYALYENESDFYIVTDLIRGGELYDLLGRDFSEEEVVTLIKSLLSCVNYCHKHQIVHRDLKPENILLEEDQEFSRIKVIDFGLAKFFKSDDNADSDEEREVFTDAAGSSYYMSPQVIEGEYTSKCDIWSVGIICFLLLGGYCPFSGETEAETAEMILNSKHDGIYYDDPAWDMVSDDALDFIDWLLTYDETARPTAEEALQHEWLHTTKRLSDLEQSMRNDSARSSLESLKSFHSADSKLKQCVYSLIASQIMQKEELDEVDQMFHDLDVNCDGEICENDMKTCYNERFGAALTEDDVSAIIFEVNLSGTGAISYSEFVIASMLEKGLISDQNLELAFQMLDKDQSGFLCFDNLKDILDVTDDMRDYVMKRIIDPADRDGDGKISMADFKAMFEEPTPEEVEEPVVGGRRRNSSIGGRQSIRLRHSTGTSGNPRRRSSVRMSFRASALLRKEDLPSDPSWNDDEENPATASANNTSEPTFASLISTFGSTAHASKFDLLPAELSEC